MQTTECSQLCAIGPPESPAIDPQRTACITPILDEADPPWRFSNSRSAFFVGDWRHYPNRRAIEFIATGLAPLLLRADPTIKLKIGGMSEQDAPAAWHQANVLFLGLGDSATVDALFRDEDLMLCPVDNTSPPRPSFPTRRYCASRTFRRSHACR